MKLKEGSLDGQIALGPLTEDQVRDILSQVLAALEKLHNSNRIHGAIRPANLHRDARGNYHLGDAVGGSSSGMSPQSAPAKYLAPELLRSDFGKVGRGADLYALGFTALELLKGPTFNSLFPGVGPEDIDVEIAWMRWHATPELNLPPVSELVPGVSAGLAMVLDQLLKKNVKERYPTAAAALHDLIHGGKPPSRGGTTARRVLIGATLLALVLIPAYFVYVAVNGPTDDKGKPTTVASTGKTKAPSDQIDPDKTKGDGPLAVQPPPKTPDLSKVDPKKGDPVPDIPIKDIPVKEDPKKSTAKDSPPKDAPPKDTPPKDIPPKDAPPKDTRPKVDPKDIPVKDIPKKDDSPKSIDPKKDPIKTEEAKLPKPPLKEEKYALLIGVRQGTPALPSYVHAEPDVETLARTLRVGGYQPDKITVLTQTRGQSLPEARPSAAIIRERLRKLQSVSTPADVLVVVLVGHAVEVPGQDGAYFCPAGSDRADAGTLIALSDVVNILAASPSSKKLLILDCWRRDWTSDNPTARARTWDVPPPPGMAVLYACGKGQTSYEHSVTRHSAFCQVLVQGLLGDAARPTVTPITLIDYLRPAVTKVVADAIRGGEQVPVLAEGQGDLGWPVTVPVQGAADYLAGSALLEKNDYPAALVEFQRAQATMPDFLELYLQRAETYFHMKQYDDALAECHAALKLDSLTATAYSSLAKIEAATKDYASAMKDFARALDLDPDWALEYNARGVALTSSRDYEAAIKDFTVAIRLQPHLVFPYGNRAIAEVSLKHWDDALADFDKAIALDDQQAFLFAQRGNVWQVKNNTQRAVEDYTTALKLDGSRAQWWNQRGKLRVNGGDLENGALDLKKATELQPKYKEAWLNLGNAYFLQAKYPMAAEALLHAVRIDPQYVRAHRQLSDVYRQMNDQKNARTHQKLADDLEKKN